VGCPWTWGSASTLASVSPDTLRLFTYLCTTTKYSNLYKRVMYRVHSVMHLLHLTT